MVGSEGVLGEPTTEGTRKTDQKFEFFTVELTCDPLFHSTNNLQPIHPNIQSYAATLCNGITLHPLNETATQYNKSIQNQQPVSCIAASETRICGDADESMCVSHVCHCDPCPAHIPELETENRLW